MKELKKIHNKETGQNPDKLANIYAIIFYGIILASLILSIMALFRTCTIKHEILNTINTAISVGLSKKEVITDTIYVKTVKIQYVKQVLPDSVKVRVEEKKKSPRGYYAFILSSPTTKKIVNDWYEVGKYTYDNTKVGTIIYVEKQN